MNKFTYFEIMNTGIISQYDEKVSARWKTFNQAFRDVDVKTKITDKMRRMYGRFGVSLDHKCKECSNFLRIGRNGKTYFKCSVYGDSCSSATDWRANMIACGFFNENYSGISIIELTRNRRMPKDKTIEGQIKLDFKC